MKKAEENKYLNTQMNGYYDKSLIWVEFTDETRKFYEKSYYGNIFNSDKKQILDIYQIIKETPEEDKSVSIQTNLESNKKPKYIVLDPLEALYLMERKKLTLYSKENFYDEDKITFDELIEKTMDTDPKIWQKYIVYRDIRHRGYIIRVGYGGNADFRVFARGAKFAKDSAKFVYYIIQDGIPIALNKIQNVINQSLGDRKDLILAIFDKLGDSTFYKLENFKLNKISDFEEMWNRETIVEMKSEKDNED